MKTNIFFCKHNDKNYGFLSNFYESCISVKDLDDNDVYKEYQTVEHYYQSCKSSDPIIGDKIRKLPTPTNAMRYGGGKTIKLRSDWDDIKLNVMMIGLGAKFDQNEYLKQQLIYTGEHNIVFHTKGDSFWGDGSDHFDLIGSGLNMLGVLLMQLRDEYIHTKK